jgi:outer membrane protein assembly factor BamB
VRGAARHGVLIAVAAFVVLGGILLGRWMLTNDEAPPRLPTETAVRSPPPTGDPWPMFRGGPECLGVAGCELPETLTLLWTGDAGGKVSSTAAIDGGLVFVGTHAGEVLAFDLLTGDIRWRYKTNRPVSASPCVSDGRVIVGDEGGTLYAVEAATGRLAWTYKVDLGIHSSAVVHEGVVIFGGDDYRVHGVSLKDGSYLWEVETQDQMWSPPSVSEGEVLIAGCDGLLYAIHPITGVERLAIEVAAPVSAAVLRFGDLAYVTTMTGVFNCFDVAQGKFLWDRAFADSDLAQKREGAKFQASPAMLEDRFFLSSWDRRVRCVSRAGAEVLWEFDTQGPVNSSPVVVGDRVFFGCDDGLLYAVGAGDGKLLWRFRAGGVISASPAVGQGRLVIGSEDGSLYCFGPKL